MRRPTETRLRRAFADVLTAVLATTAGAMAVTGGAGCGGSTTTTTTEQGPGGGGGGTTPAFTSLCSAPGNTTPIAKTFLQGMRATPDVDGAVRRSESAFRREGNTGAPGTQVNPASPTDPNIDAQGDAWNATNIEEVGAMCAKASNPTACREKVGGFRILPTTRAACVASYQASYFEQNVCSTSYILYTRGDEIGVARTNDEIKALLGTFDTLEEALWVAENKGLHISCSYAGAPSSPPDSEYRTTQDGGWDLSLIDNQNCGNATFKVLVHVDYAGNLTEVLREDLHIKPQCAVAGRRPEGFHFDPATRRNADAVGEHFAAMATLEAASVTAFRRLHRQLAAFGAPKELLARIRKAARDEIRHARATGALARKYGVRPAAPQIAAAGESPSLFAIALENAREGCVRETYGALVAHLQTTRAGDADVRACMAAIADEETEHAALSWDIAEWIEAQLGDAERTQLADERRDAFTTLANDLAAAVDLRVAHVSGVPGPREALRMLEGLAPMMLAA